MLEDGTYGLAAIKNELDEVRTITGEIYNLIAPVPCGCGR
jgi:hypothetical protein